MRRRLSSRPALLQLENRLTPAGSAYVVNGNLYVAGDPNANNIVVTDNVGSFSVGVDAMSFGPFTGVQSIYVNAGKGNDSVNVNLASILPGTLFVNGEVGNDIINVNASSTNAKITGVTSLNGGADNDQITLANGFVMRLGNVAIAGGGGNDQFDLHGVDVSGFVSITDTEIVNVGNSFSSTFVKGGIVDQAAGASPAICSLNRCTIGSFLFVGGGGADTVNLGSGSLGGGTPTSRGEGPPPSTNINGAVTLTMGEGDNLVNTGAVVVSGIMTTFHGMGHDSVNFGPNSTFFNDVTLFLGNGNNLVTSDGFPFAIPFFGHDLRINAGNGNDVVRGANFMPSQGPGPFFNAFVNHAFSTDLGDGNNSFGFLGGLGGNMAYKGGSGIDAVTIAGFYAGSLLDVQLGAGNDTFTFGANTVFNAATLDFGPGTDTYHDNGASSNFPITFIGQP